MTAAGNCHVMKGGHDMISKQRDVISSKATGSDLFLVSVVIPCHNQARFLSDAIDSVLKQSYPRFEIIVVDDGSTDNTIDIAARYREVRCVRQENRGLSLALAHDCLHALKSLLTLLRYHPRGFARYAWLMVHGSRSAAKNRLGSFRVYK